MNNVVVQMKECEICGDSFEYAPNRKYCPDCAKNPEKARKLFEMAQAMIKRHSGETDAPKIKNCKHCGKEFATYFGSGFCSAQCKNQYRIKNAECSCCHVNLYSIGIKIENTTGGVRFCSEECKKQYYAEKVERNRKRKATIICEYCEKEFYPQKEGTVFCCRSCYEKAKAEGWKPASQKEEERKCKRCHNQFKARITSSIVYCKECSVQIRLERQKREQERKEKEKLAKQEAERKKLEEGIKKNGLCFYCQTSHFNCERMQTNFVYYPKGCKVEKGKVLECPSYTEKNKKGE